VSREEPRVPRPEQQPFRIEVEPEPDGVRVILCGELDLATGGHLNEQLDELRTVGLRRLVLDLRELEFIDSTGLRLILRTSKLASKDRIDFTLLEGPEEIQRVFEIAGLTDVLPFRR